jgi:hypothetical protein
VCVTPANMAPAPTTAIMQGKRGTIGVKIELYTWQQVNLFQLELRIQEISLILFVKFFIYSFFKITACYSKLKHDLSYPINEPSNKEGPTTPNGTCNPIS